MVSLKATLIGGVTGFLGMVIAFVGIIGAALLYQSACPFRPFFIRQPIPIFIPVPNTGYSAVIQHVSELGVGPTSHMFNTSLILAGVLAIPFLICLLQPLGEFLDCENRRGFGNSSFHWPHRPCSLHGDAVRHPHFLLKRFLHIHRRLHRADHLHHPFFGLFHVGTRVARGNLCNCGHSILRADVHNGLQRRDGVDRGPDNTGLGSRSLTANDNQRKRSSLATNHKDNSLNNHQSPLFLERSRTDQPPSSCGCFWKLFKRCRKTRHRLKQG